MEIQYSILFPPIESRTPTTSHQKTEKGNPKRRCITQKRIEKLKVQ